MAKKKVVRKAASTKAAKGKAAGRKKAKRKSAKRELINTGTSKRYVRRAKGGQFKEVDEQGRSLSQDRRRKAKRAAKSGQGDRGDRRGK